MPINFYAIPEHIKTSIMKKQDISSIARLTETSQETKRLAMKMRTRATLCVNELRVDTLDEESPVLAFYKDDEERFIPIEDFLKIPLRFEGKVLRIDGDLSSELCERLRNVIVRSGSSFFSAFVRNITCTPAEFNDLLEVSAIREISIGQTMSSDYLESSAINEMEQISLKSNMIDEELMSLNVPWMTLNQTNVSSSGINCLIKYWLQGSRDISEIRISTSHLLKKDNILEGVSYSEAQSRTGPKYFVENKEGRQIKIKFNHHSIIIYKSS